MKKLILFFTIAFLLTACHTVQKVDNTMAFVDMKITCMGVEGDGSQTLRSWGKGRDKSDAIEQAKKNAVAEVIFKGITSGSAECNKRPLINTPNAREKYETYFDRFFSDGGEYKKYVTSQDENKSSRIMADGGSQESWSVIVRVKRSELKELLINDGILKQ